MQKICRNVVVMQKLKIHLGGQCAINKRKLKRSKKIKIQKKYKNVAFYGENMISYIDGGMRLDYWTKIMMVA